VLSIPTTPLPTLGGTNGGCFIAEVVLIGIVATEAWALVSSLGPSEDGVFWPDDVTRR